MAATFVEPGDRAPRRRARVTPPRVRRIKTAVRLSAISIVGLGALAGVATLLYLNRGDAEGSARIANRELDLLLSRGETVEQRVLVQRRRWYDYFRVTHGVLAATDRRLLYVGIPPEDLLPREHEPLELDQFFLPYDRAMDVARTRGFAGALQGVRLWSGSRSLVLGVTALNEQRLDSTLSVVARRLGELRAAADAERRAVEAATAASRRAIYHLVQPGEALASIATRYGTSVDSLRVWNQLSTDRISSGKRLLVRPAQ